MYATDDPGVVSAEDRFARFAIEAEARSPLYAELSRRLAEDASPASVLMRAPDRQRRPTLWFAALHEVLLDHPDEPLAGWYPSCGGGRTPSDPGLWEALLGAVGRHDDRIERTVTSRRTQTNEIGRTAGLRLALTEVVRTTDRPVALVELGTSAGLLLLVDRIAHRYGDADPVGPADPRLSLDVAVRGAPPPRPADDLHIAARVGLDLEPMDPADPATASWLRACVWPEHTHRLARLDAALALAAQLDADPATSIAAAQRIGDVTTDDLEAAVRSQPEDAVVVLWSSSALAYVHATERDRLQHRLADLGRERTLWQATGEGPFLPPFADLDDEVPAETDATWNAVGLTRWSEEPEHRLLARMGPHGDWVRWLDLRDPG